MIEENAAEALLFSKFIMKSKTNKDLVLDF